MILRLCNHIPSRIMSLSLIYIKNIKIDYFLNNKSLFFFQVNLQNKPSQIMKSHRRLLRSKTK